MLGRDNGVAHAEKRIGAGGINGDIVIGIGLEGDLCAVGAAYPVLLLGLDALDKVKLVEIVDKTVGVLGDAEHPLALLLADNVSAAALALALYDLLVCEDALAARAPVDGHSGLVGEIVLEKLEEYPLGPLVVGGVGGVDNAIPIEAEAEHLELLGEVFDVALGDYCGVDMVLDGEVLCGQTESIKAYREQDIVALHSLLAGDNVDSGVGARMADVQACCGGVRELYEAVELGLVRTCLGGIGLLLFPNCLPFLFYFGKIVSHVDLLPSDLLYFLLVLYFASFIARRPYGRRDFSSRRRSRPTLYCVYCEGG